MTIARFFNRALHWLAGDRPNTPLASAQAELDRRLRDAVLEDRIELILQENEALHGRLDAMIVHAQTLEAELREWESQGPAPSLLAASKDYQFRISRLEEELRQSLLRLREPGDGT